MVGRARPQDAVFLTAGACEFVANDQWGLGREAVVKGLKVDESPGLSRWPTVIIKAHRVFIKGGGRPASRSM